MSSREEKILRYYGLVEVVIDRLLSKGYYKPFRPLRDDLIGEGQLGLIQAIDTYDPSKGAKVVTYISLKVRGYALDFIRKHRRITTPEVDIDNEALQRKFIEELSYDPWNEEEREERFELIDKYEPKDEINRKIYHLVVMGGLTCKELAEEFQVSLNCIKKRKKRFLIRLHKEMENQFEN